LPHSAAAIANTHLYAQVDKNLYSRITELETLAQIDQQLNVSLDFDHVVETTYRWALQGTGANDGWMALCGLTEPGSAEPLLKIIAGRDKGQVLSQSDPMVVLFLARCSPVEGGAGAARPKEASAQAFPATKNNPARLAIPILIAGKFIGILSVEHPTDFSESASEKLKRNLPPLPAGADSPG